MFSFCFGRDSNDETDVYEAGAHAVTTHSRVGDISEGVSFKVTGFLVPTFERFNISLKANNDTGDIVLFISPRLPHRYITRNSKIGGVWGREEMTSSQPFVLKRDSDFQIQILVTEACYMISVNGYHFANYSHRMPYKSVKCIEVKGDVERAIITRGKVKSYPDRLMDTAAAVPTVDLIYATEGTKISKQIVSYLPLPYYGHFEPKSFTGGRCLKIKGCVKMLPEYFSISLQKGRDIWPQPDVAFHFRPQYYVDKSSLKKETIISNARIRGQWLAEEYMDLDTNLLPRRNFSLIIVSGKRAYEVYLNQNLIDKFVYRLKPDVVDTVLIQGDIKLRSILFGNKLSIP